MYVVCCMSVGQSVVLCSIVDTEWQSDLVREWPSDRLTEWQELYFLSTYFIKWFITTSLHKVCVNFRHKFILLESTNTMSKNKLNVAVKMKNIFIVYCLWSNNSPSGPKLPVGTFFGICQFLPISTILFSYSFCCLFSFYGIDLSA